MIIDTLPGMSRSTDANVRDLFRRVSLAIGSGLLRGIQATLQQFQQNLPGLMRRSSQWEESVSAFGNQLNQ